MVSGRFDDAVEGQPLNDCCDWTGRWLSYWKEGMLLPALRVRHVTSVVLLATMLLAGDGIC